MPRSGHNTDYMMLLLFKISFVKTDSKNCEDILNKLKALGVGRTTGTSIRY